jgi:hypothetical protein
MDSDPMSHLVHAGCPTWQCPSPVSCQDGTNVWTFSGGLVAGSVNPGVSAYEAELTQNGPIVGMHLLSCLLGFLC